MSKIINSINGLMSKQSIGTVMSRSAIAKELGVSERTITRAMGSPNNDESGEWVVVSSPSLVRVSGAVCPDLDKTLAKPKVPCPDSDKPSEPKPPSAPFVLPSGFTIQQHKYAGRVVVDSQGRIDSGLTAKLAESETEVDPWMADGPGGEKPKVKTGDF